MVKQGHFAKTHVFEKDAFNSLLEDAKKGPSFTKTKIVITMGPSLKDAQLVCDLLEAGATCARIDLTWREMEHHRNSLRLLQEAMRRTRRLCAVMLDCMGRDVLVRRVHGAHETDFEPLDVAAGAKVTLTTDENAECTPSVFPVTYAKFPSMVQPGDSIFVGRYLATGADQSSLFLEVTEVTPTEVYCVAKNTCRLDGLLTVFHQERSAEGLSNLQNSMPPLDEWDKEAIVTLSNEFEIDFVTMSYCRSAEDIQQVRDFLGSIGREGVKVVAKCETRESLLNFSSISAAADAIIIARGNLGLDVAPEKMATVQKAMISACSKLGKPTLITRVVDTMISTPRPTRAEATDVANAVLDGCDGILLGAETYRGQYPLETVRTVAAICREAELVFDHHTHYEELMLDEDVSAHLRHSASVDGDELAAEYWEDDPELPRSSRRPQYQPSSPTPTPYRQGSPDPLSYRPGSPDRLRREGSGISMATDASMGARFARLPSGGVSMNTKLESIASGAVKAADKVGAALIVCITHTGRTASMIAKYRPAMPIMTLVVPYLRREEGLKWTLEGRSVARQALLTSGLLPVLAAPTPSAGESLLEEAILLAAANGLVKAHDHIVAVSLSSSREPNVKIISVSADGEHIKKILPASLRNLLRGGAAPPGFSPEPSPRSATESPMGSASSGGRRSLSRVSVIMGSRADALVPFEPDSPLDQQPANGSH